MQNQCDKTLKSTENELKQIKRNKSNGTGLKSKTTYLYGSPSLVLKSKIVHKQIRNPDSFKTIMCFNKTKFCFKKTTLCLGFEPNLPFEAQCVQMEV